MEDWLDRFSGALGDDPITREETGAMLKLARDVAHEVERKLAPLSTFLAGVHVGRRLEAGASREAALGEALAAARSVLPEPPEED